MPEYIAVRIFGRVPTSQVVGVVGIFGIPEEVRDTGRLVKAITELILERELLQEETRSRYRLREQFLETAFTGPVQPETLLEWGRSMIDSLRKLSSEIACCAMGSLSAAISGYAASYRQALYCLGTCRPVQPLRSIYDPGLLIGYALLEAAGPAFSAAAEPLAAKFRTFIAKKIDGRATLQALLASNLNLSNAAQILHIHRNTLMFRLDQFRAVTSLDPVHNFEDAAICRILLELEK